MTLSNEQQQWKDWLEKNMPAGDRGNLLPEIFVETLEYAARVRRETPCSMVVPDEIFRNAVLPYAHLDERRDPWRQLLFESFSDTARRAASIEDAVVTLNRQVFDHFDIRYHPTKRPHNHMSVAESIACGYASCTGLSILLACACRAVGIPARLAGTPLWVDGSGNHTWVEFWDHGRWRFIGAAEPGDPERCWFNGIARLAREPDHGIYAAWWEPTGQHFPLSWDADSLEIPGVNRIEAYRQAPTRPQVVTELLVRPREYVCPEIEGPLKLTGALDDPSWLQAPWTEAFLDIECHRKPAPRFRTRVKMLWDDDYFYVGAKLEDPHVWATLTEQNSIIFNDPDFEIFIDPDGDNHKYYEFEINALGTIWELTLEKPYRDGGPVHRGDNMPGLISKVQVQGSPNDPGHQDQGWTVEVAIPWEGLRRYAGSMSVPPRLGDQWRINFSRVHWLIDIVDGTYQKVPRQSHPEDNWVWSPQHAIDMHRPEQWGYVQFEASAETPFVRDSTWPARELLMEIYYAQRQREQPTEVFAELGIRGVRDPSLDEPELLVREDGTWRAEVDCRTPSGEERWRVDSDSKLSRSL